MCFDFFFFLCNNMLRLFSITLTLMQGHSGSTKAKIQCWIISTTKQATTIKIATTVGHLLCHLDFANVYMAWPTCCVLPLAVHCISNVIKLTYDPFRENGSHIALKSFTDCLHPVVYTELSGGGIIIFFENFRSRCRRWQDWVRFALFSLSWRSQ